MTLLTPDIQGSGWIDELSDEQCKEIFWLYVDDPDQFLSSHPAPLLGRAMRYALHQVARSAGATPETPG